MKPDHPAFARIDHRPWPMPHGRWTWRQNWHDLLFAHWPIPAADLRHLVPDGLAIQEYDGASWIGVVPFRMTGVMRRPFPDVPWVSAFPELNVRVYVERDGKPGVWFLSLDAANPLAVWAAQTFLPSALLVCADGAHAIGRRVLLSLSTTRRRPAGSIGRPLPSDIVFSRGATGNAGILPCGALLPLLPGAGPRPLPGRGASPALAAPRSDGTNRPGPIAKNSRLSCAQAPLLHFSRGVDVVIWPLERLKPKPA